MAALGFAQPSTAVSDETVRASMTAFACRFHPDVAAMPIPSMGGGMGVVATRALPAGSTVASIPYSSMLTAKSAAWCLNNAARARGGMGLGATPSFQPISIIVAFLIGVRTSRLPLLDSGSDTPTLVSAEPSQEGWNSWVGLRGVAQHWIQSLPSRYDTLLELPPSTIAAGATGITRYDDKIRAEIHRALTIYAPEVAEIVLRCSIFARAADEEVRPLVEEALLEQSCIGPITDRDRHTIDVVGDDARPPRTPFQRLFLWGFLSLMSRGFAFPDDVWAMMPWVDYFNYTPITCVAPFYNEETKQYQFTTRFFVSAGDQLLLTYGCYCDFEIALWYGFTLCRLGTATGAAPRCTKDLVLPPRHDDHHQPNCAYCFSTLADPNGDYDRQTGDFLKRWFAEMQLVNPGDGDDSAVDQLVRACAAGRNRRGGGVDLTAHVDLRLSMKTDDDDEDNSFGDDDANEDPAGVAACSKEGSRKSQRSAKVQLSADFQAMIKRLATALKCSCGAILRRIVKHEISQGIHAPSALPPLTTETTPADRARWNIHADSVSLLQSVLALSDGILSASCM